MDVSKPATQTQSTAENAHKLYTEPPTNNGHMGSVCLEMRRVKHQIVTTLQGTRSYYSPCDDPSAGRPPYAKFIFHFQLYDARSEAQREDPRGENHASTADAATSANSNESAGRAKSNTGVVAKSPPKQPRDRQARAASLVNSEAAPSTTQPNDPSDAKRRGSDSEGTPGTLPVEERHREKRRRLAHTPNSAEASSDSENEDIHLDIEVLAQSNARIEAEICADQARLTTLKEQAKYLENKIIFFRLNEDIRKTAGQLSQPPDDDDDLSWEEVGDAQFFLRKNSEIQVAISAARERLLLVREKAKYDENKATLAKLKAELLVTQTLCQQLKSNIASKRVTGSPTLQSIENLESKPVVSRS